MFGVRRRTYHINILELYPIVAAIELWCQLLSNQCVLFMCDNMTVVNVLNSHTSKDVIMMKLIRKLVVTVCTMNSNILFKCQHISAFLMFVLIVCLVFRSRGSRSCSMAIRSSSYGPRVLDPMINDLLSRHCLTTHLFYSKSYDVFHNFVYTYFNIQHPKPSTVNLVISFIAHMHKQNKNVVGCFTIISWVPCSSFY